MGKIAIPYSYHHYENSFIARFLSRVLGILNTIYGFLGVVCFFSFIISLFSRPVRWSELITTIVCIGLYIINLILEVQLAKLDYKAYMKKRKEALKKMELIREERI